MFENTDSSSASIIAGFQEKLTMLYYTICAGAIQTPAILQKWN